MEDLIDPEFETEFSHYEWDYYLADLEYLAFENMIGMIQQEIYDYNKYGAIWEEADRLAEEEEMREHEEAAYASMYRGMGY
jgi:hypothetical protein